MPPLRPLRAYRDSGPPPRSRGTSRSRPARGAAGSARRPRGRPRALCSKARDALRPERRLPRNPYSGRGPCLSMPGSARPDRTARRSFRRCPPSAVRRRRRRGRPLQAGRRSLRGCRPGRAAGSSASAPSRRPSVRRPYRTVRRPVVRRGRSSDRPVPSASPLPRFGRAGRRGGRNPRRS